MGRKESSVQKCFRKERVPGARCQVAICKGCGGHASPVPSRMEKHAQSCKELHASGRWTPTRLFPVVGNASQVPPISICPSIHHYHAQLVNRALAKGEGDARQKIPGTRKSQPTKEYARVTPDGTKRGRGGGWEGQCRPAALSKGGGGRPTGILLSQLHREHHLAATPL